MQIRKAENRDASGILKLLSQVLEIHASLRPDIFISGTTKYTEEEIYGLIADETRRSYIAADESGNVLGYALCILKEQPKADNLVKFRSLYIDDLCVESSARGKGVGRALFEHVKAEAKKLGCYEITLNVWEGNDPARAFYDRMGMRPKETNMEYIL